MTGAWGRFFLFYAFCFLFLGLVPAINAMLGGGFMNFDASAARASAATGVAWDSNIVHVVRLSLAEPGLWLLVLGSAAPTLAAIAALSLDRRPDKWLDFARRLHPTGLESTPWKPALAVYAGLAVAIPVCLFATLLIRQACGLAEAGSGAGLLLAGLAPALLTAAFLDQGALLEEGGWRGYGVPVLADGGVSPLAAAVIIGIAWGLWHVPRDVVIDLIGRLGLVRYLLLYLPAFTLGTISVSVIACFAMNKTGGSLWPAIMAHGLANDSAGIGGRASIEQALTPGSQLTGAAPLALLALVIAMIAGRNLGRRK